MSETPDELPDRPGAGAIEPTPSRGHTPLGLDYFAPHAPDRKASRAANFALSVVIFSVLPFICGVLNAAVAASSYSTTITGSHRGGATLFLAAGMLVCALGLARLIALRHWAGVAFAAFLLVGQIAVVGCIGLTTV